MTALPATFPDISKLVPLLGSDKPGEVVAAAAAITRTLKRAERDWHDLGSIIDLGAKAALPTISVKSAVDAKTELDIAIWCRDNDRGRLSSSERDFIANAIRILAYGGDLTAKQRRWLTAIHTMLGGRQ